MTTGDWLMALACFFFILSGLAKGLIEGQRALAVALVFVGVANAILLTLSNERPDPPGVTAESVE